MILNLLATSLLQVHTALGPPLLRLFALPALLDLLRPECLVALGRHRVHGLDEVAEDEVVV